MELFKFELTQKCIISYRINVCSDLTQDKIYGKLKVDILSESLVLSAAQRMLNRYVLSRSAPRWHLNVPVIQPSRIALAS
jgi:ABC-type arginine transport system ATPase subunit